MKPILKISQLNGLEKEFVLNDNTALVIEKGDFLQLNQSINSLILEVSNERDLKIIFEDKSELLLRNFVKLIEDNNIAIEQSNGNIIDDLLTKIEFSSIDFTDNIYKLFTTSTLFEALEQTAAGNDIQQNDNVNYENLILDEINTINNEKIQRVGFERNETIERASLFNDDDDDNVEVILNEESADEEDDKDTVVKPPVYVAPEPTIIGTDKSEKIVGTDEDDVIQGGAGSDNLYGGSGDDTFLVDASNAGAANDYHGGEGTDKIVAQDGEDIIINRHLKKTDSIEEIIGEVGENTQLKGDNSSQTIDLRNTTLSNIDKIDAGAGNDTVYASNAGDTIIGGAGSDNLYGGSGDDTFLVDASNAGAANDYHGGEGTDKIVAQDGEDIIINRHLKKTDSIEEIIGEVGENTQLKGDNSSQTIDLRNTTLSNIDKIDAGAGNDTVYASNAGDTIIGGAGSDNLYGGSGDDTFLVDASNAGAANDYHGGEGTDKIVAQDGEDIIINRHLKKTDSIEEIIGEVGENTQLKGDNSSQTIDLRNTTLSNIDKIDAGAGNDTVYASNAGDTIIGGAGSDNLYGGSGDDTFLVDASNAGAANDYHGGEGTDKIVAQDGEDIIINRHLKKTDSIEEIIGEVGENTQLKGDNSSQTIDLRNTTLSNIDKIDAGAGNDTVYGTSSHDYIDGNSGTDRIYAGGGDDQMVFDLKDFINGEEGFDTLLYKDNDTFDFEDVNNKQIKNIEAIDLENGNSDVLTNLSLTDVLDMTDHDQTLYIKGDGGDKINLLDDNSDDNNWVNTGTQVSQDGTTYNVWTNSDAILNIDEDIVVDDF